MKLNLRKANALQLSIADALKEITLKTDVVLNEFQSVDDQISSTMDKFKEDFEKVCNLTALLYYIRGKIAVANFAVGIAEILTEIAYLDKSYVLYKSLGSKRGRTDPAVLLGRLNKLRETKEDPYYGRTQEVETSIFSEDRLSQFRKLALDTKKQKQNLQDKLLELNVQSHIELEQKHVKILEKYNLI